jgi:phospholipid/cholesterol/gamma-HCH transport system substrate-binding protein
MDERVMQFRVGVMVLAALLVAVILALVFGGLPSPFRKTFTIQVKFSSAPGVSVGTPVRKSGIRIGEVSSVEFAADDQVLVTLRIAANYQVRHDETCCLRSSLLGDTWLEFESTPAVSGTDGKPPPPIGRQSND